MPPEKQKRKRAVASCTQCYSKKQKCNHQYPCNHCTHRRLPELCSYNSVETEVDKEKGNVSIVTVPTTPANRRLSTIARSQGQSAGGEDGSYSPSVATSPSKSTPSPANLSSCLGYLEGSKSNMLGLMEKFDLVSYDELAGVKDCIVPQNLVPEVEACMQVLPKRFMLDRLVQHFLEEVNWISEMIHPASFLTRYEQWWRSFPGSSVENLDFCVLILTICAYSAQYLPSRSFPATTISGVPHDTIREECFELAARINSLCVSLPGKRSLTCVQYLYYAACYQKNEGRVKDAYYALGDAIRLAHDLRMHMEISPSSRAQMNELEKDLRRRAFWNLYLWDRFLSIVLDRLPYISDELCTVELPKMRLVPDIGDDDAPEVFTERALQVRLMRIFDSMTQSMKAMQVPYDPILIEEQYEEIRHEYISTLPPAFDINNPELKWDVKLPMLARQRLMLRISVFIVLCQLFRPLLRLAAEQLEGMPSYKLDLILKHRSRLVDAAFSVLDNIYRLHDSMGGKESRFFFLGFYTFEPAMILAMHLLSLESTHKAMSDAQALNERDSPCQLAWFKGSPSGSGLPAPDVAQCRLRIQNALERLKMLGEGNAIAKLGACKLREVIVKIEAQPRPTEDEVPVATSSHRDFDHTSRTLHGPGIIESSWLGFEMVREKDVGISSAYPTPDSAALSLSKNLSTDVLDHLISRGDQWLSSYYHGATGSSISMDGSPFYGLPVNNDLGRIHSTSMGTGAEAKLQTSRPQSTPSSIYKQPLPSGHEFLPDPAQYKGDWQFPTEATGSSLQSQFL
ncbi:hypothetical protein MMC30_006905 [Trapelia coarctata]|nr:hypothetical protein [Trapelia coarctata]